MSMEFSSRHIGPDTDEQSRMLRLLGYADLDAFTADVVPEVIRWHEALDLPEAATEAATLAELRDLAARNRVLTSMIGLGYYGTYTPGVITRNILENPAWYTAYTPYQPEISQGRLEALLNFQTMVEDLTALPVAGSSLLDEPTAVAEAMTLSLRASKTGATVFVVDADTHPQTLAVLHTRAEPLGITVVVADLDDDLPADGVAGVHGELPRVVRTRARPGARHRGGPRAWGARDRHHRPAGADPAHPSRANSAPTSSWGPPSGWACRSASAVRTPASWRYGPGSSAACPGGSSE